MVEGEYESQKALAAIIPDNVVIPMAWCMFEANKSKAFFITHFRNLCDRPPPTVQFLAVLKKLHQTSVSPNVRFGFQVTTFNGPPVMVNDWTDSLEGTLHVNFVPTSRFCRMSMEKMLNWVI